MENTGSPQQKFKHEFACYPTQKINTIKQKRMEYKNHKLYVSKLN